MPSSETRRLIFCRHAYYILLSQLRRLPRRRSPGSPFFNRAWEPGQLARVWGGSIWDPSKDTPRASTAFHSPPMKRLWRPAHPTIPLICGHFLTEKYITRCKTGRRLSPQCGYPLMGNGLRLVLTVVAPRCGRFPGRNWSRLKPAGTT